jgi:D-alanyl-lipoteichoic acid acyltransferase DltB (MBOAT superfamily)
VHGPVWDLVAHLTPPLAVSFYTFVEIAYLVDTSRGETRKLGPIDFSLFMAFFPKLISGPIVRFHEMAPQLETRRAGRVLSRDLMIGLVLFSIGLFKKTAFADTLAPYTAQLFTDAHQHPLPAAYAWLAATLFTFQLYFDFSGYSDMAIGIARMFDIKLPLNFHSPLRAASIIDFWRRWHMTLQRWVVSYIFQPMSLPINRMAASVGLGGWSAFLVATAFPIFITFVVLGVWHGAGWTFAVFGVMHGVYLAINEAWREHQKRVRRRRRRAGLPLTDPGAVTRATYHGLTLGAVLLANIAFRSPDLGESWSLWRSMAGAPLSHAVTPAPPSWTVVSVLLACAFTVFCLPNSQQIMGRFQPALNWEEWKAVGIPPIRWSWKPSLAGLVFAGLTLFVGVMLTQRGPAIFVYYNF